MSHNKYKILTLYHDSALLWLGWWGLVHLKQYKEYFLYLSLFFGEHLFLIMNFNGSNPVCFRTTFGFFGHHQENKTTVANNEDSKFSRTQLVFSNSIKKIYNMSYWHSAWLIVYNRYFYFHNNGLKKIETNWKIKLYWDKLVYNLSPATPFIIVS